MTETKDKPEVTDNTMTPDFFVWVSKLLCDKRSCL